MGPKKMMCIELKHEIIEKHEQGVRVTDLARMYGRSASMICTVLKQKELIKSISPAKGITIISKLRTSLHEKTEKLLMVWMTEKQLEGETLTQSIICEKARAIYGDLLKQIPHTSTNKKLENSFKASRGWFDNFRKRTGFQSVIRHDKAASLDVKAAKAVSEDTFEGLEPEVLVVEGKSMDLKVDERDVNKLVKKHSQELKTEELHHLHSQQHKVDQENISFEEEPETEEVIFTREIKEVLGMWEKIVEFVGKNHPEKVATSRASELFNETCLSHFRDILKKRKTMASFFKRPAGENKKSVIKKAKV